MRDKSVASSNPPCLAGCQNWRLLLSEQLAFHWPSNGPTVNVATQIFALCSRRAILAEWSLAGSHRALLPPGITSELSVTCPQSGVSANVKLVHRRSMG